MVQIGTPEDLVLAPATTTSPSSPARCARAKVVTGGQRDDAGVSGAGRGAARRGHAPTVAEAAALFRDGDALRWPSPTRTGASSGSSTARPSIDLMLGG